MERVFLRSAIQATESTCTGWSANRAAAMALAPRRPVIRRSTANSSSVFSVCRRRLLRWCPAGLSPKSWQSSMCDSHVTGCQ